MRYRLYLCLTINNTLTRLRNINRIPFRSAFSNKRYLRYGFRRAPQDRLTHDQILFTWNPYPRRSTRMSLVCLLLPPRSVLVTAPRKLTFNASTPSPHSSYSYQSDLQPRLNERKPLTGFTDTTEFQYNALAPSIFRVERFGR